MLNILEPCITIPGQPKIHPSFQLVQDGTLLWAEKFELSPLFKPLKWYVKARFGLQAAREYPEVPVEYIHLAGDLLTWLFTVDDTCDRGSADQAGAIRMSRMLSEFIALLEDKKIENENKLSAALKDLLLRFRLISSHFLYRLYCQHMIDYLQECQFEIEMQLENYTPNIATYYKERPFAGFYIMFPLVGMFNHLELQEVIYSHPIVKEIELYLNMLGCLSNDLHSVDREAQLEKTGFNLIFIAQKELNLTLQEAIEFVKAEHGRFLEMLEQSINLLPDWGPKTNEQVKLYINGLKTVVRGYDDWAILDTGRYQ